MTVDFESLTLRQLAAIRDDLKYLRDKFDDSEQQLIQLHSSDAKHIAAAAHFYRRFRDYEVRLNRRKAAQPLRRGHRPAPKQ